MSAKTIYTKTHRLLIKKLVKTREKMGFKQKEVAKKLGKTQSYISKIESGQRRIDIVQLKELAEVYKKNTAYFLK